MKQPPADSELGRLFAQFPRAGRVDWIGLRPRRLELNWPVARLPAGVVPHEIRLRLAVNDD